LRNFLLAPISSRAAKNQSLGAPPPPPPELPLPELDDELDELLELLDEELDELLLLELELELELEDELLELLDDELEELLASVTVTGVLTTSLPDALPLITTEYTPALALCTLVTEYVALVALARLALLRRHCQAVPVNPDGAAVSVKFAPGATAVVGAPVTAALTLVGVTDDAPAMLPAPALGAVAVSLAATLAVGIIS
jgi:hypothetical protein